MVNVAKKENLMYVFNEFDFFVGMRFIYFSS